MKRMIVGGADSLFSLTMLSPRGHLGIAGRWMAADKARHDNAQRARRESEKVRIPKTGTDAHRLVAAEMKRARKGERLRAGAPA